jgi:hypothetical protein
MALCGSSKVICTALSVQRWRTVTGTVVMRWRICTLARKPACENAEEGGASRHIHEKLFEVIAEVNNAGWLRAQATTKSQDGKME